MDTNLRTLHHFRPNLLWFLVATALALTETQRPSSRVVSTKYGTLRGVIVTLSNRHLQPVEKFLGVPYAGVPTGSLRFMPPVTPPHWKGVRPADQLSPVCPQKLPDISNDTEALKRMPTGRLDYLKRLVPFLVNQSEDCLYLNIYAPASDFLPGVVANRKQYVQALWKAIDVDTWVCTTVQCRFPEPHYLAKTSRVTII